MAVSDDAQVASVILGTTIDLGAPGPDPVYGMGEVDLAKALAAGRHHKCRDRRHDDCATATSANRWYVAGRSATLTKTS